MKSTRDVDGRRMNVALNGELLEEVICFEYLGSMITVHREMETEVKSRIKDVGKVLGGMKKKFNCREMGIDVRRELYEGVAVLTALYGDEAWIMAVVEKGLDVMEMTCLRMIGHDRNE